MALLDLEQINLVVRRALEEDIGTGDVTTQAIVPKGLTAQGIILAKETGTIAGIPVARATFRALSKAVQFEPKLQDGQKIDKGGVVARIRGPAGAILTAERVALNFLQRLSGIATQTARYVQAVAGTRAKILDTRKTTPGLRYLEKYAVRIGGGHNHRMGLHDMVLIKDNHIKAGGGVAQAIKRVRAQGINLLVEVEASDLEQVNQAIQAGVDRIMLDNMNLTQLEEAVALIHSHKRRGRKPELEASGKIDLSSARQVAMTGVDLISVGALTHSAPALDMSLTITDLVTREESEGE